MLDVRPIAYVIPLAEQPFQSLTPTITVVNNTEHDCYLSGLVMIYRRTTGVMIYCSVLHPQILDHNTTANVAAETPWSPPAPADDDYFIMCDTTAAPIAPDWFEPTTQHLGTFDFDIKPVAMGIAPAAHHATHEQGGSDPILVGDLGTAELDTNKVLAPDGAGGLDWVYPPSAPLIESLPTAEMDDTLVLSPDGASGVHFVAIAGGPGVMFDPQVLTDGANIAWDLSLGGQATVTLGGNRTLDEASNKVNGGHYSLRIIQDGTGTRLITWHASYRFPAGVDPCLSAAPNNIDILLFLCDGTNLDCVGMVSAVA